MKSLCAIQDGGLGGLSDAATNRADRIKVLQDRISVLNAALLVQYKIIQTYTGGYRPQSLDINDSAVAAINAANAEITRIQTELNALQLELNELMGQASTAETAYQNSPTGIVEANKKTIDDFRRQMFLLTRPGFDYGFNSDSRNKFFARDSGLGFDLMGAVVDSLKKNAPGAFSGVKGGEVLRSIVPNAGGPKLPKVKLPSWLPTISLPKPLQDAAKRAGNLAISTAKDVAAKKKAADAAASASGVAVQTSEYSGGNAPGNSLLWIGGGAAILAAAFLMTRKK